MLNAGLRPPRPLFSTALAQRIGEISAGQTRFISVVRQRARSRLFGSAVNDTALIVFITPNRTTRELILERYHCWAAIGWEFKSELVFYDVPTNTNGKMSHLVYRDVILSGIVAQWLARGDKFVLEEDGDSGHGGGNSAKGNIVKEWKKEHGLKHFFNTPGSPDLSPIENCWRAVKQYVKANFYLGADLKALILEGWRRIEQKTINQMVDSMVVRMADVLASKGQMTAW
jgi:hypothetical protein